MDKFCNKCKKVFGATEGRYTGDIERKGKKVPLTLCANCITCDSCKNAQAVAEVEGKDFYFVCQKCKDSLNTNDKDKCSFCGKKASQYYHKQGKPETKSCHECRSELWKPADYDPNAKAYCKCGKTSKPFWEWDGNNWNGGWIVHADCCKEQEQQEEYDQCKCGEKKSKKELLCKNCIAEREREREREREQNWKVFGVFEPLRQSPTLLF